MKNDNFWHISYIYDCYTLNRSPADGNGASPSCTDGSFVKSGILTTCAFISSNFFDRIFK
ncbi:hypothetical protein Ocin01_12633 [Orchesella cincta]|uniref:Uncharacterized protein n=1 Tax=Orchesella cincta TaxID=48709 RepID=A0A1D2MM19_ORCCI|nr:hypothetical protein Ocin01_12633 [Orchesella cincta]